MSEGVGVTWGLLELGVGPGDTGDLGMAFHSRGESKSPSRTHGPTSAPVPRVPQESAASGPLSLAR